VQAIIPLSDADPGGPSVTVNDDVFTIRAERDGAYIVELQDVPDEVKWFGDFEYMYARRQHDASAIKVIRRATAEELKRYRVPIWIQDEEIPECCGRPMHFVGQIDDDRLCGERPDGARYWWHDAASFYVFTCSQCLGCKAVGQQY
jgi:hypothetical protein